jgi:hypothetical protein
MRHSGAICVDRLPENFESYSSLRTTAEHTLKALEWCLPGSFVTQDKAGHLTSPEGALKRGVILMLIPRQRRLLEIKCASVLEVFGPLLGLRSCTINVLFPIKSLFYRISTPSWQCLTGLSSQGDTIYPARCQGPSKILGDADAVGSGHTLRTTVLVHLGRVPAPCPTQSLHTGCKVHSSPTCPSPLSPSWGFCDGDL